MTKSTVYIEYVLSSYGDSPSYFIYFFNYVSCEREYQYVSDDGTARQYGSIADAYRDVMKLNLQSWKFVCEIELCWWSDDYHEVHLIDLDDNVAWMQFILTHS